MLTPKQVEELIGLIDVHVDTFIGNRIGVDFLTDEQKKRLTAYGIKLNPLMTVDMAFRLGMLSDMIGRKAQTMTFEQMLKELKAKNYLPLSFAEKKAVERLNFQAYNEIRGLGNKIKRETGQVFIEADQRQRAKMEGIIRDTAQEAVLNRLSVREMKSLLGHRTQDWARDFDRISDYILHDAHDHGRAAHIERVDGAGGRVYKHVFDQACQQCVKLYLTNGPGSEPKAFTPSELRANGTNIGRKTSEWKPVIGPTHPWCFSDDTEVLTGRGWMLFKDVLADDMILSVDLETGDAEMVGINKKIEYGYNGKLWHYKNNQYDVLCTPNHRHPVKFKRRKNRSGDRYERWQLMSGEDLPKNGFKFLKTIPNWKGVDDDSVQMGDMAVNANDFCEFMGYYLSEGSISKTTDGKRHTIKIAQEGIHYDKMRDCCIRVFGNVWKAKECIYVHSLSEEVVKYFYQFGHSHDKYIPEAIKSMDKGRILIFLNAYLDGDGTVKSGKFWKGHQFSDERKFYTSSNRIASDIGELILKVGGVPTYSLHKPVPKKHKNGIYTAKHDQWHITWKGRQHSWMETMTKDEVDYDSVVYCLELEKHHTLFVRRNGKVTLSGNCRCSVERIPKGAKWNPEKQDFIIELTERQRQIADFIQVVEIPD